MTNFRICLVFTTLFALCPATQTAHGKDKDPTPPSKKLDFTKGDQMPKVASHDWTLGPIGARGWVQVSGRAGGNSAGSRQILITKVDPNGPSAQRLFEGDVIVGVDQNKFESDARISFARNIQRAESSNGNLQLEVFRRGNVKTVSIKLPKLQAFSDTAPFDCPKSKMILDAGCKAIQRRGLGRPSIPGNINALALLATGDPAYKETISDYVRLTLKKPLNPKMGLPCWSFSFTNIFLCEYYLASGDQSVLPEIQRLTDQLVRGQGPLGTWGHSFVDTKRDRLKGYGAVNSVGLPAAISLVLASECGVEVEGLKESIALSASFFRRHVNLGAIPYGDGPPNTQFGHDDNGKNSSAAIFFNLLGDEAATLYYTRSAMAAFGSDREQGHTGNFFNMFWGLPAVSIAGPEATGAWIKEFGWYYDLARDNRLRFPYQGYPTQTAKSVYAKWDCPGAYLLHFALPLKELRIAGRDPKLAIAFKSKDVAEAISAGKMNYRKTDPQQLQQLLGSWSPIVRKKSAAELKRRKIAPAANPRFLNSDDAQEQIAELQMTRDFAACSNLLKSHDVRVQVAAFEAMTRIDRKKAWLTTVQYLANQQDISPVFTQAIGNKYFPLFIRAAASGKLLTAPTDRQATRAAITRLLNDEDCLVSSRVAIGLNALPEKELVTLLPLIYEKSKEGSIGNVMFGNKLKISCAEVLVKLKLREGAEVASMLLTDTSWGKNNRLPPAAKLLRSYGGHAREYLEPLRATLEKLNGGGDIKWRELINETIRSIEQAPKPSGKLRSIQSIQST